MITSIPSATLENFTTFGDLRRLEPRFAMKCYELLSNSISKIGRRLAGRLQEPQQLHDVYRAPSASPPRWKVNRSKFLFKRWVIVSA
jgi:hypothetical protein